MSEGDDIGRREQLTALARALKHRPLLTAGILVGGVFTAMLEGVGLTFIMPIVQIVRTPGDPTQQADGLMAIFVSVYDALGVPFTLGFVVVGVSLVLVVRWTVTFFTRWGRSALVVDFTRDVQGEAFERVLDVRVEYVEQEGSDDVLNAIVTQAEWAGNALSATISFIEEFFLTFMYALVAFVLAPYLTLFAALFLGGISLLFRYILEPGYDIGDRLADANEQVHRTAQAGVQGIRDSKLFGLKSELLSDFAAAVDKFAGSGIKQRRNQEAIQSFYNLLTAVSVFLLVYLAIRFADMSLSGLGIFLFAMFRLGPKASSLNSKLYTIENSLAHLVRTYWFIDELERYQEPDEETEPVPERIEILEFENVGYSYAGQERDALSSVSFRVERGEFVGFAGQSGAGKSTIVSLLTRLYEPDSGEITVNGRPIHRMDVDEWRSRIAVVRQQPFIFNDTLRYNLTIGNRDATDEELDRICRVAKVDEFLDELSDGYDTQLGDDGVRLSGGQRQRVALARALLKDVEVLVLDEATSDLDSSLEKQVQEGIERIEQDYTILGIAHRLSTLKSADRLYTMSDGQIIETGTHRELLNEGGEYARLYSLQSKEAT